MKITKKNVVVINIFVYHMNYLCHILVSQPELDALVTKVKNYLITNIDSAPTEAVCVAACEAAGASLLGPFAVAGTALYSPLCHM